MQQTQVVRFEDGRTTTKGAGEEHDDREEEDRFLSQLSFRPKIGEIRVLRARLVSRRHAVLDISLGTEEEDDGKGLRGTTTTPALYAVKDLGSLNKTRVMTAEEWKAYCGRDCRHSVVSSPPASLASMLPKPLVPRRAKAIPPNGVLIFGDVVVRFDCYKQRLVQFYRKHNPNKLKDVDEILRCAKGQEALVFKRLEAMYGQKASTQLEKGRRRETLEKTRKGNMESEFEAATQYMNEGEDEEEDEAPTQVYEEIDDDDKKDERIKKAPTTTNQQHDESGKRREVWAEASTQVYEAGDSPKTKIDEDGVDDSTRRFGKRTQMVSISTKRAEMEDPTQRYEAVAASSTKRAEMEDPTQLYEAAATSTGKRTQMEDSTQRYEAVVASSTKRAVTEDPTQLYEAVAASSTKRAEMEDPTQLYEAAATSTGKRTQMEDPTQRYEAVAASSTKRAEMEDPTQLYEAAATSTGKCTQMEAPTQLYEAAATSTGKRTQMEAPTQLYEAATTSTGKRTQMEAPTQLYEAAATSTGKRTQMEAPTQLYEAAATSTGKRTQMEAPTQLYDVAPKTAIEDVRKALAQRYDARTTKRIATQMEAPTQVHESGSATTTTDGTTAAADGAVSATKPKMTTVATGMRPEGHTCTDVTATSSAIVDAGSEEVVTPSAIATTADAP
eukprot:g5390.t1